MVKFFFNKNEFLIVLSAATTLVIIFSTMFLTMNVQKGASFKVSQAFFSSGK